MRKTYIILLSLLALGACTKKYEIPSTFEINIKSVYSTRATISVKPGNEDIWYSYVLIADGSMESLVREEYVCSATIERGEEIFEAIRERQDDNYASFEDIFFFKGSRELQFTDLEANLHHKVLFFQVNPKTHKIIGNHIVKEFTTQPLRESGLGIDIYGQGDRIWIHPSLPNEAYIWDYERTDIINTDYYMSPRHYLYSLVQMYFDYGFLDSMVSRGPEEYIFNSESDRDLIDGKSYTLSAVGIDDRGEFTSELTSVEIIYHDKKGIEIIYPQY